MGPREQATIVALLVAIIELAALLSGIDGIALSASVGALAALGGYALGRP